MLKSRFHFIPSTMSSNAIRPVTYFARCYSLWGSRDWMDFHVLIGGSREEVLVDVKWTVLYTFLENISKLHSKRGIYFSNIYKIPSLSDVIRNCSGGLLKPYCINIAYFCKVTRKGSSSVSHSTQDIINWILLNTTDDDMAGVYNHKLGYYEMTSSRHVSQYFRLTLY